jgi:hypothetical protein
MLIHPTLVQIVEQALQQLGSPLTEFELMQYLDKHHPEEFSKPDFNDALLLFQHHFILRHIVYLLQTQWFDQKNLLIDVELVKISWTSLRPSNTQSLAQHDNLKTYYLDLNNLEKENNDSIQQKLNRFWQRYKQFNQNEEALIALGLENLTQKATPLQIKKQYQRLANTHHPDKGGDALNFQKIRWAYEVLKED